MNASDLGRLGNIDSAFGFVEMEGFADDWQKLGYDDDDLLELQNRIRAWPKAAPVVAGTAGLRKLRFASQRQRTGKRGGSRVGYVFFEEFELVLLVIAYAKTSQRDILQSQKKIIRQLILAYEKKLARQWNR